MEESVGTHNVLVQKYRHFLLGTDARNLPRLLWNENGVVEYLFK
jgi:hypothetical protein